MVFLHPNPLDNTCWLYQMAHFSTWFVTLSVDMPGYGRSPAAAPGLTMFDLAQACWEAVDEVSDQGVILAGCSIGASTALHMAQQKPIQTLAVIVSGISYSPVKEFAPRVIGHYRQHGKGYRRQHVLEGFSPSFRESSLGHYFADVFTQRDDRVDLESVIALYEAAGAPDPDWLFDRIKAPTLILTGSEDHGHKGAFELQKRIRGCELVTIQGAGHACYMEKPWEWDSAALRFLARHGLVELDMPSGA